ncbi:hypothetical protein Tco_0401842 [Tanacetum coccineum]
MKTKSKSFKRKFPYDSNFDYQPIGISKKQNLGPIDAFGHATIINGDNHTLKPPLATYYLHEEPSAVRDLDTRKPAHSHINIDSEPVVMSLTAHFDTANAFCTVLPFTSCMSLYLLGIINFVIVSIPSGRILIVPSGRYVVPADRVIISFLLLVQLGSCW